MGTMSKEEILKILEDAKDKNSDVPMRLVRQAFEKLPEPCEDTVSRAKINAFCHVIIQRDPDGDNDIVKAFEAFRAYVNSLPSVTPKPRTGKWYKPVGMMPPEYAGVYRCSKCDEIAMRDWKHHKQVLSNFCPNCGSYNGGEQDESI